MRKQHFPLLFFILGLTSFLHAQSVSFAPVGAKWTYNKHHEIFTKPYGAEQYRYVVLKDTIVFGWNARIMEGEVWTDGAFVPSPSMRRFVSVVEDKVYHLVDSTFELLYNFGAQTGDTIFSAINAFSTFYNPGYNPYPIPPASRINFSYVIDSTGTIDVQGKTLRTQFVHNTHDMSANPWQIQGIYAFPNEPIIERIGSFPSALWFGSGFIVLPPEGQLSTFRCYQDDEIYFEGNTLGLPCDSVVGVNMPEQILFSVSPNPFTSAINIDIPDHFGSLSFSLFDLTGMQILQQSVSTGNNQIATYHLNGAFYFWQITQRGAILGSGKLIKTQGE